MPKRKSNKNNEDYIVRKIKKLEKKLLKRVRKSSSSSSDNFEPVLSPLEDNQPCMSEHVPSVMTNAVMSSPQGDDAIDIVDMAIGESPVDITEPNKTLDNDILELLGESPSTSKKYSPPIQEDLAIRWEHIATTGLAKEIKKEILEKYLLPENCIKIGSPQLNPEIKAALSETLIKKDKTIAAKQDQQAIAITCLSQALTEMLSTENKDTTVIKLLIDAARLLCDHQHAESMSRRMFVSSTIKKEIKDHLYLTDIDTFLFGDKLPETLKAAKAITRSGADMISTRTSHFKASNKTLNSRPPFPQGNKPTGTGRKLTSVVHQSRNRYAAPPPKSQGPRHQPPPPPPAQQQRSRGRPQARR